MIRSLLLLLALPFAPSVALPAQATCSTCDDSGMAPCRVDHEVEDNATACSFAMDCRGCRGALARPCDDCEATTAASAELDRRIRLARDYVAESRALLEEHDVDGRGVLQCRTENFDLLFAPGRIKGIESDPHRQMHLYASWLEELRRDLAAQLGVSAADFAPGRIRLAVIEDESDHRKLSRGLTGLEVQGLGRLRLDSAPAVVLKTPSRIDDASLRRLLAHSTTHLLVAGLAGSLDQAGFGWLDVGLAHWFEAMAGSCEYFCVQATPQRPRLFWGGDWRTGVRELLEAGTLPAITDLVVTEASDLDFAQHALAFALIDFMFEQKPLPITHETSPREPPPMHKLLRAVQTGSPSTTALTQALGRDLEAFKTAFLSFVRTRYSRR